MAIAQMNWGRMRYDADDPRMAEFMASLASVYAEAEGAPGFIWRLDDDKAAAELAALGYDARMSATVSVWEDVLSLRDYVFSGSHGAFLERRGEWFERTDKTQLVIWTVSPDARPGFSEAFRRLAVLEEQGPTDNAFGWPES